MTQMLINRDVENRRHPHLDALRVQLQHIHASISHLQPLLPTPPILDASVNIHCENLAQNTSDSSWLQPEIVPGLKDLRDAVKRDLDALEKVSSTNVPQKLCISSPENCVY